jgi:hypothetical protein
MELGQREKGKESDRAIKILHTIKCDFITYEKV